MGKIKSMKKGEAKALSISHPNSRKAKALTKKVIKKTTRKKTKMEYAIKRNLFGEKLLWFHKNLEQGEEYTALMLDELLQKYLKRFDEELEQISIKHSVGQRKNRQHANREDIVKMTLQRDLEEYNSCGLEMVDILSKNQLKLFRDWDGEMGFLNQFNIRRFSKSNLAKCKLPLSERGITASGLHSNNKDGEMTELENSIENCMAKSKVDEGNDHSISGEENSKNSGMLSPVIDDVNDT